MRRQRFPSLNSLRVLAAAFYEMPLDSGLKSRRGYHNVVGTCIERGALTIDQRLTSYGLQLLAAHKNRGEEHAANP